MHDELGRAIRGLIGTERGRRAQAVQRAIATMLEGTYSTRGNSRYPIAVEEACAHELERRASTWLEIVVQSFARSRTSWTSSNALAAEQLLNEELDADWDGLLGTYRAMVNPPHPPDVRHGLLEAAKERGHHDIANKIALLRLEHDHTRTPVVEQLAAPRYASALDAWQDALNGRETGVRPADIIHTAVGSVEQLARIVTGDSTATLGECIKKLRSQGRLEAPLLKGVEELWGWSSSAPGVRHGSSSDQPTSVDVEYTLRLCEAALLLLLALDRP